MVGVVVGVFPEARCTLLSPCTAVAWVAWSFVVFLPHPCCWQLVARFDHEHFYGSAFGTPLPPLCLLHFRRCTKRPEGTTGAPCECMECMECMWVGGWGVGELGHTKRMLFVFPTTAPSLTVASSSVSCACLCLCLSLWCLSERGAAGPARPRAASGDGAGGCNGSPWQAVPHTQHVLRVGAGVPRRGVFPRRHRARVCVPTIRRQPPVLCRTHCGQQQQQQQRPNSLHQSACIVRVHEQSHDTGCASGWWRGRRGRRGRRGLQLHWALQVD